MNDKNIERLIDAASKKSGANKNTIRQAVNSGDFNNLINSLKPDEMHKIKNIINDKSALEKLLNTEQVQKLIKNLNEGK